MELTQRVFVNEYGNTITCSVTHPDPSNVCLVLLGQTVGSSVCTDMTPLEAVELASLLKTKVSEITTSAFSKHLVLITGPPGSGKNTVGKDIAARFPAKYQHVDESDLYARVYQAREEKFPAHMDQCDEEPSPPDLTSLVNTELFRKVKQARQRSQIVLFTAGQGHAHTEHGAVFYLTTPLEECFRRTKLREINNLVAAQAEIRRAFGTEDAADVADEHARYKLGVRMDLLGVSFETFAQHALLHERILARIGEAKFVSTDELQKLLL